MSPPQASIDAAPARLRKGEYRQGARLFAEKAALGPDLWDRLLAAARETFVRNAPIWLDEQCDPARATLDLNVLARCTAPVR
ncbi:hypothetical protein [Streptomyces albiflavescens]|nr:hypothetical protein [Streptomyces albiflavescens]